MSIVAGVDFGTLSVRVTLLDSEKGRLGTAIAEYPLHRKREDPDYATQSHKDQMDALVKATRKAIADAKIDGQQIEAMALDTTGSSVIPVGENLEPLDDYYLWCDHRAKEEAQQITELAHKEKLEAIEWCGGVYSHEWGFAKLLHWLRHNPEKRGRFVTAFEHCDMVAETLCGITDAKKVKRSVCAMGHKWMWNPKWDGLPSQEFLSKLDPLFDGIREKLDGEYATSDKLAGHLSSQWAEALGLRAGIPIPVGAFDAHCDAIARRAGHKVSELSKGLENYRAGQTGLLRLSWDNGDRTVLVNSELGGVTLGWNLVHTAQDELHAAIEGTAFHTRIILERMAEYGVPVDRVINAGGIPQNNQVLNQIYADVLGKPVLVPAGIPTSLGSGIFALLAAKTFPTVEAAQDKMCLSYKTVEPDPKAHAVYNRLFALYRKVYFALGRRNAEAVALGDVLAELRKIAAEVRRNG